jgi:hypothetical protein
VDTGPGTRKGAGRFGIDRWPPAVLSQHGPASRGALGLGQAAEEVEHDVVGFAVGVDGAADLGAP